MNFAIQSSLDFHEVSLVDASHIKSKWQAHFLQCFPLDMDSLPQEHESDKECFEKYWRGQSEITFEQFKEAK